MRVDSLIQAIYHRMAIFGTSFDEHGAGILQDWRGITVINFGTLQYSRPAAPENWVGVYPYDTQAGVAVDFYSDEEDPDPVWDLDPKLNLNRVGYPVSPQIDGARVLSVTSFTLAAVGAGGSAS